MQMIAQAFTTTSHGPSIQPRVFFRYIVNHLDTAILDNLELRIYKRSGEMIIVIPFRDTSSMYIIGSHKLELWS